MKTALQVLAPWISVLVFWVGFQNAWAALLGYHVQILCWHPHEIRRAWHRPTPCPSWVWILLLTAPVMILLLPAFLRIPITDWLQAHGLTLLGFTFMIPWFGIVHPILEQIHWTPLRNRTPLAHPLFAGYHLLVLHELLTQPGLFLSFAVLCTASIFWHHIPRPTAIRSHQLADTGIALAGLWFLLQSQS